MTRRGAGVTFIAIAALLFSVRYLSAAIFGSEVDSWSKNLFQSMLQYVGPELLIGSGLALALGAIYLLWAEITERRQRQSTT